MQKTIAIMLLDNYSKVDIKTDIADFSLQGVIFINSLSEITESILEKTHSVIITTSFFKNATSFSEIALFKELYNLSYYFVGNDKQLLTMLSHDGFVYECDIEVLDFDMLESALCVTKNAQDVNPDDTLTTYKECYDFANKIIVNAEEYDAKLYSLAESFIAIYSKLHHTFYDYIDLSKEANSLRVINRKLLEENQNFADGIANLLTEADALNKNLEQYEYCLSKPIYEKLSVHGYSNRPRVIYLKVYEELYAFDQFLETLTSTLQLQERLSVKVLKLYDNSSSKAVKVLPNYYKVLKNSYLLQDVICNQYLCKVGDYRDVLDILLTNREGLDVLLLVDCKDFEDTVLNDYTVFYNVCQNAVHAQSYNLLLENTLVSFSDEASDLNWDGYDVSEMEMYEQFVYLSSRKAITSIINSFKLYSDSM